MADDIADLTLAVNTAPLVQGSAALAQFAQAAQQAAGATAQAQQNATQAAAAVANIGQATTQAMSQIRAFNNATSAWAPSPGFTQFTQGLAPANQNLHNLNNTLAAHARGTGLAAHQWANLSFQVQDVLSTLAQGMNPLQVLTQQGPQIYQAFSTHPGGAAAGMREAVGYLGSFLTPMRAVTGGVTLLAGAVLLLQNRWSQQDQAARASLSGIGRLSGQTIDQVRALGDELARTTNLSRSQGQGVANALSGAGIGAGAVRQIGAIVPDIASTYGVGIKEAQDIAVRGFSDAARGADFFNERLLAVNASTRQQIRDLQAAGRSDEARLVLLRAVSAELVKAADNTSVWMRIWNALGNAADSVLTDIGKGLRTIIDPTLEMQRRQYQNRRTVLEFLGLDTSGVDADIQRVNEAIEAAKNLSEEQKRLAQATKDSLAAQDLINQTSPEANRRRELENQRGIYDRGIASKMLSTEDQARAILLRNQTTDAINTLATAEQNAADMHRLELEALNARSPAEIASIERRREEIRLRGQLVPFRESTLNRAEELTRAREEQKILEVQRDLLFERQQMMRSATEQRVYSTIRPLGIDVTSAQGQIIADQIRLNEAMKETQDLSRDVFQGMANDIMNATKPLDMLNNMLNTVLRSIMSNIANNAAGAFNQMIWGPNPGQTGSSPVPRFLQMLFPSLNLNQQPIRVTTPSQSAYGNTGVTVPIAPVTSAPLPPPAMGSSLDRALGALRAIESGRGNPAGNYSIQGPVVTEGMYRGQRAQGAYQIMPGNIPSWSREALGYEVTPQEFISNPDIQDRIARYKFDQFYQQHGNFSDAASKWHSGRTLADATARGSRDVNMRTTEYVDKFNDKLNALNQNVDQGATKVSGALSDSAQKIGESGSDVSNALSKVASSVGGGKGLGGLVDAFFAPGGKGAGTWSMQNWGSIDTEGLTFAGEFATGGAFRVGGTGGTDSQEVSFRASPNEVVSVYRPEQLAQGGFGGGKAPQVNVNVQSFGAETTMTESVDASGNRQIDIQAIAKGIEASVLNKMRTRGTPLNKAARTAGNLPR